ncbi:hypothetical protein GmHk_13G036582 [Glycine max]|nr:hypothetical protein GmHk_13G036582 [Glycine max]
MRSQHRAKKKDLVRKCGCPFKLRAKPVVGGEGWMVNLICGSHNYELIKFLVGHPYVGTLTKDEKIIVADMTKSMVEPRNILLTLKKHNVNSYTTIKQIYNARNAYRSSIRGSTYKTNRYRLLLLDIVGMTPTGMTFSAAFAYLEGERLNNIVWALQRFNDLFLGRDALPKIIVTDRDLALMNAAKTFDGCLKKFEIACSPWPMVVDYVNQTWVIPHKERFLKVWTNKVMHLGSTTTNSIPLETIHMFWRRLSFSDQGLYEPQVSITEEMETISKRFKELDVCGKVTLKSKLRKIAYLDLNSMCAPPEKVKTKGAQKRPVTKQQRSTKCDPSYWEYVDALHSMQNSNSLVKRSASSSEQPFERRVMPMLDQFHPCIHDSIVNIVDMKVNGNCGYRAVVALLGMGEDSWSLVRNHLLKELTKWSDDCINLVGGID